MCFFPLPNYNRKSPAFRAGVTEFECGACPECLSKRASRFMLRDVYEARDHLDNCMLTLTYDNYLRDAKGNIIGEQLADRRVDVRDVQLFIKRLRAYAWRHHRSRFKYRVSAEYGKRTHRPHYHVLIFGFTFPDCVYYKKSKRGSVIYSSSILNRLWRNGICTVDAKRITPAIAKYCSKYTMKDAGAEDTFSICSHGIGIAGLLRDFNGLYYTVEGVRYPVPRKVWEVHIVSSYGYPGASFSCRYKPRSSPDYELYNELRANYRMVRDADPFYQRYLAFWREEASRIQALQPDVFERIRALPEKKYHGYKVAAMKVYMLRRSGVPAVAPRARSGISRYIRWCVTHATRVRREHLPLPSCLATANDTVAAGISKAWQRFGELHGWFIPRLSFLRVRAYEIPLVQCNFFDFLSKNS